MGVTRGTAAAAALVLLGGILGSVAVAAPAGAALTGATSTTTTEVVAGVTTALAGLGVSAGAADSVFVTVGTTRGRLTVGTGTGITPAYGYGATGAEVAFSGTGAQVNAALASLALTTDLADNGATAEISLMARSAGDAAYSPSTGHFYQFVTATDVTWTDASTGAAAHSLGGQAGYLATVPDASVNDLIASRLAGAENVWLGGQAADVGGNRFWTWQAGPLAGTEFSRCSSTAYSTPCDFIGSGAAYRSWSWGEPNNWDNGWTSPGEAYMVTNWQGSYGLWNDLPSVTWGISGYVVEYGNLAHGASAGFTGVYTASSTVTIIGVPSAPTITAADPGDGSLLVAFAPPPSVGGSPVTAYDYSLDDGATWSAVPSGALTSPAVIPGLTNGTEYTVRLRAVNTAGAGAASNGGTGTPCTLPSAPSIGSVTAGNHLLVVAFTPGASGGRPVLGYRYSLDGGATWSTGLVASTASPLVIYGLDNGVTYDVALRAVSTKGDGYASAAVEGRPVAAPVAERGSGGALPELGPGIAGALVNGQVAVVSSGPSGNGWGVSTANTTVVLEAYDTRVRLVPTVDGSAFFEGYVGGYVLVQGQGFRPGTTADVWLFSTPVTLGEQTVRPDGTFSAMLPLPFGVPVGGHTIQIDGVNVDRETVSASLGVRIGAAQGTLAATGADVRLFPVAALVAAGAVLLAVSRRRRWLSRA